MEIKKKWQRNFNNNRFKIFQKQTFKKSTDSNVTDRKILHLAMFLYFLLLIDVCIAKSINDIWNFHNFLHYEKEYDKCELVY